ncbi:MAG: ACP S-malonyltransferase [Eubacterium sp.]|nr:ACP S-malonyltransferase [Eubacterium sp.]
MGKVAFIFDGKGTQYPGMGKEFFDEYYAIKQQLTYLEQYRIGILRTMFYSSNKDLERSIDLYPGLFLADLASYLALKKHGIKPDVVAGFGVGEMMAISASGILSFDEAFQLACRKSNILFEVDNYRRMYQNKGVRLEQKRVRELKKELTEGIDFVLREPLIPIYSVKKGEKYPNDLKSIVEILSDKIFEPDNWKETIIQMYEEGVDVFVECGPGDTLSHSINKILKNVTTYQTKDRKSLERTIKGLKKTK